MESKQFLIVLAVLLAVCSIVVIEGAKNDGKEQQNKTSKMEKLSVLKKKLLPVNRAEVAAKSRLTRSLSATDAGDNKPLTSIGRSKEARGDLMTAAHEKKYMLVKKKPKHKKIKMEVFKPKMKYKKIKMKVPVKKMKKKKVKGYLVKKEHGHHEY